LTNDDEGLFAAPTPVHPDAAVAHEEIARYFEDQVAGAREKLEWAQAEMVRAVAARTAWTERGEIPAAMSGRIDMAATWIASASISRYQQACHLLLGQLQAVGGVGSGVVNRDPNAGQMRAEAERLGEREKALRRWLTAQGHDLMAATWIASASISRYQQACHLLLGQLQAVGGVGSGVVNRDPNAGQMRAEAERLGEREKALRRWLTAQGHDLGALAEPTPDKSRGKMLP
jgi:hypothetical protein